MHKLLKPALVAGATGAAALSLTPAPALAYPVDCAILLCLAGGWPASLPCSEARAVFMARLTPWPIEPPLQIWLCPMSARFEGDGSESTAARIVLASAAAGVPHQVHGIRSPFVPAQHSPSADIDISGPEFDFVRSIRVYDIQYSEHADWDGNCTRRDLTRIGTYGSQGDFAWTDSTIRDVAGESDLEVPPICRDMSYRSVLVEWRDIAGHRDLEEINY